MGVSKPTTHKVKKGDTLIGIAKKYGHRDWKVVWDAPENKAVVKKRKDPKKIDTGDVFHIPLNAKQQKENDAALLELNQSRNAAAQELKYFGEEAKRIEVRISTIDMLVKTEVDSRKMIVAELKKNLAGMKRWADGVDAVAMLTQMGVNLGSLAKTGAAAAKASGDTLAKLNKQALKQAADLVKSPATPAAGQATKKWKDDDNAVKATIGILVDSWIKMTSPSFWANTYVQMTENGKSWSDAVTMDVGDDIKKRIAKIEAESTERLKKLLVQKKALEANLVAAKMLAKGSETRIRALESAARAF